LNLLDNLFRLELFQAASESDEAVMTPVLVEIERIDHVAKFHGEMPLRSQKRADRTVPHVRGMLLDDIAFLVRLEAIQKARDGFPNGLQQTARLEVFENDVARRVGIDFRIDL